MTIEASAFSPALSRALGLPDGSLAPPDLTSDEKGSYSEIKVATALMDHPEISRVTMTEHYSPDDMRGRDIIILFKDELERDPVFIQVKSSHNGADIYNKKTKKWLKRRGLNMTTEEWMAMNRIMLIIGNGNTPEEIRESFDEQLHAITSLGKTKH